MRSVPLTFSYDGITAPDGAQLTGVAAHTQWQKEFLAALPALDDYLPGYGFAFEDPDLPRGRAIVRLLVSDETSDEEVVLAFQKGIYDEGGLSGGFRIGRERAYKVAYLLPCEDEVWAYSDEGAKGAAEALAARCEATLVSVVERRSALDSVGATS